MMIAALPEDDFKLSLNYLSTGRRGYLRKPI